MGKSTAGPPAGRKGRTQAFYPPTRPADRANHLLGPMNGELKVSGTKLFEHIETTGGTFQLALDMPATVTIVCKDGNGNELGRLSELPGRFRGGLKELWYEGGWDNSPLSIMLGPVASGVGGSLGV